MSFGMVQVDVFAGNRRQAVLAPSACDGINSGNRLPVAGDRANCYPPLNHADFPGATLVAAEAISSTMGGRRGKMTCFDDAAAGIVPLRPHGKEISSCLCGSPVLTAA